MGTRSSHRRRFDECDSDHARWRGHVHTVGTAAGPLPPKLAGYKQEAAAAIDGMNDFTQQMVDSVFSFGELGFQEFETQSYLTGILEKEGFTIERGVAGIPTAWTARWGSGKPVIALGSDIDCIPQASQKPGVAYHDPIIDGAPGHGEGHNSGMPLNITAALAVKKIMEREKLPGTLVLWPGVAEELLGDEGVLRARRRLQGRGRRALRARRHQPRDVAGATARATGWCRSSTPSRARARTAAGAPWRGRSALDAVELMDIGWNFRREHLRIQQRSHYVITNGGDQPNVVPRNASVWYYFRETTYPNIKRHVGNRRQDGARRLDDDRHHGHVARARVGLADAHEQDGRRDDVREHHRRSACPKWTDADVRRSRRRCSAS